MRELYLGDKYRRCAEWIGKEVGTVLDIGSRDRVLHRYLQGYPGLHYKSADIAGHEHDYIVNLERGLPFQDSEFDFVVALDVLEHVDHIHDACSELFRTARRSVLIALPNLASWQHRLSFLLAGRLRTDKYEMTDSPRPDRHRWLPTWPAMDQFVAAQAHAMGFRVEQTALEAEAPGPITSVALRSLRLLPIIPPSCVRRALWRCTRM